VSSLAGAAVPRQAVYSESLFGQKAYDWVPLHAFRTDALKVIDAPETEIYNIKRDPSETINLAGKDAAATASLRPQLDALMQTIGVPSAEAVPVPSRRDAKALIASNNSGAGIARTAIEVISRELRLTWPCALGLAHVATANCRSFNT
jgi:hypothetical protein